VPSPSSRTVTTSPLSTQLVLTTLPSMTMCPAGSVSPSPRRWSHYHASPYISIDNPKRICTAWCTNDFGTAGG
jgi:hypothetical protein